jgi:hypothetical protein
MASIGGSMVLAFKSRLSDLMHDNYNALVEVVHPLAEQFILLYIVIMGYNCLRGNFGEWTKSVLLSMAIVTFVYSSVFELNLYIEWLYEPIMHAIDGLVRIIIDIIGGYGSQDFEESIDAAFASVFKSIYDVGNAADGWGMWTKLKVSVAVGILLIVFGLSYLIYFGLLIVSLVSIHVQFVMGIFVAFLAAFKGTRHIFFAWLKDTMTYALWPIYAAIVMSITLFFFNFATNDLALLDLESGDVFSVPYAASVITGFIGLWLFWKVPQFAASITGGAAGGAGGLASGLVGGLAGGISVLGVANKGKDAETGHSYSRLGRSLSNAKEGLGSLAGSANSRARGYIQGRKMENYND